VGKRTVKNNGKFRLKIMGKMCVFRPKKHIKQSTDFAADRQKNGEKQSPPFLLKVTQI